jgi:hypothetical protein
MKGGHRRGRSPGNARSIRDGMATRRTRHSREELHALLLSTGCSLLREEGLGTGVETLTFKRVFDRIEKDQGLRLTNASVIRRVWHNQAEFQADVLSCIAQSENEEEYDRTVAVVAPVLASLDPTSEESRRATLRELCRLGADANMQVMRESNNWPLWIGAWGVATGRKPFSHRKKIEAALTEGYESFNSQMEAVYESLTRVLGFRLRESFTLRQFTVAVDSLGQGSGLRDRIDDAHKTPIVRKSGSRGESQEWSLFGIAFEAMVNQFFELDPDWQPDHL